MCILQRPIIFLDDRRRALRICLSKRKNILIPFNLYTIVLQFTSQWSQVAKHQSFGTTKYLLTKVDGVTFQKTINFIATKVQHLSVKALQILNRASNGIAVSNTRNTEITPQFYFEQLRKAQCLRCYLFRPLL